MNNNQTLLIQRTVPETRPFLIGSLLGLGAAFVGVSPLIAGFRPWHLLVIAAFIMATSQRGLSSLLRLRVTVVDILFLSFIFSSAIVEYVNAGQLNYDPELVSVFTDLFYVLAYLAVRLSVTDVRACAKLLRGVVWPAVPMAVVGIFQLLGSSLFIQLSMAIAPTEAVGNRLDRGDSVRAWGLTGHWTGFGGYLTCVIAALVCIMLIDHRLHNRVRKSDVFSLGILFSGVLATLTFSVVLSAIAIILFSLRKLRVGVNGILAVAFVGVSAALALGPFLAGRFDQQFAPGVSAQDLPPWLPSTLAYRLVIWERETLPALFDRPFLGWGSGAYDGDIVGRIYPTQLDWLSAESQWFSLAIGYGIVVSILFALLICLIGVTFIQARKKPEFVFFQPLVILWMALFLTSFTVAIFTNRGTPSIFYILLGCAVAMLTRSAPLVKEDESLARVD